MRPCGQTNAFILEIFRSIIRYPKNSLTRFSHHEVATKYRHDPVLILLALWVFVWKKSKDRTWNWFPHISDLHLNCRSISPIRLGRPTYLWSSNLNHHFLYYQLYGRANFSFPLIVGASLSRISLFTWKAPSCRSFPRQAEPHSRYALTTKYVQEFRQPWCASSHNATFDSERAILPYDSPVCPRL